MAQLVRRFSRLSALALVARSLVIEQGLAGNPAFSPLAASILILTAAREALEEAIRDAADGGRTAIARRRAAERELRKELNSVADVVSSLAGGDEVLILRAGFFVRSAPNTLTEIPQPLKLRAEIREHKGEVRLTWATTPGASLYVIQHNGVSPDDAGAWKDVGETTRIRHIVKGLVSAKEHWFRVRATGSKGSSPWSAVAHTLVR
jgi:hypothetical protein